MFPKRSNQFGLSLIELMIAMTISMVLVGVASYSYIASKGSYRTTDEQTQIFEEGRYALELLGKNIRLAGYIPVTEVKNRHITFSYLAEQGVVPSSAKVIQGCEEGFDKTNFSCATSAGAPDAFSVTYFTDDPAANPGGKGKNSDMGVGVDCSGSIATTTTAYNADGTPASLYWVQNWYYLDTSTYVLDGQTKTLTQLLCKGNGNASPQPLFKGVKDMQLSYGIASTNDNQTVDHFYKANELVSDDMWSKVISIKICLLMETAKSGVTAGSYTYKDCDGATKTSSNNTFRQALTATYNLRNRVPK